MKNKNCQIAIAIIAGLLAASCASTKQARKLVPGDVAILGENAALLQPGKKDEALMVYIKDGITPGSYKKAIIGSVKIAVPENTSESMLADIQKLANNFRIYVQRELGKTLEIVETPGPETARVELAIYNPGKRGQVMNFVSGVVPVGVVISAAKDFATGKPAFTGEASSEAKITDAQTGELLGAGLDRRVGTKYNAEFFSSWGDANNALEFEAKQLNYRACKLLVRHGCVKPE